MSVVCLLLSSTNQRDQRKREESRNLIVLFELRKPSKRILKFVPRQNSASKAKDFALIVVRKIIDLSQRPSQVILTHDFRVNRGNSIVDIDRALGFVVAFCLQNLNVFTAIALATPCVSFCLL